MNKKIAIIGYGHMGKALHEGLLGAGLENEQILISNSSQNNKDAVANAMLIILAVKPTVVQAVLEDLRNALENKVVISASAVVPIARMQKYTLQKQKIVRIMPNIPVAQQKGVIGFFANQFVSSTEKKSLIQLFQSVGIVIDCAKEADLDAITILSGSGPATVAYCIGMLARSGQAFGLTKKQSEYIALQTFVGSLALLQNTGQSIDQLQNAVATKGGATEAIIRSLEEQHLSMHFGDSLKKGLSKIERLQALL